MALQHHSLMSVEEYLLIDTQRPIAEVYRREKQEFWLLRAYRLDETIELTSLGVHFSVEAIYEDVTFPPPYTIVE